MNPIDTYRYAFQQLLAQGKTPLEALREFDREKWNAAMLGEIDLGGTTLLNLGAAANREEMNEGDMEQATELWLAGWTSETPSKTQVDVMSWYWRRPPRRKGKPGRFYWSTNQAYNAMRKESELPRADSVGRGGEKV